MKIKKFGKEWVFEESQNFNFYCRLINKKILKKDIKEADKFVNLLKKKFRIKSNRKLDYFIVEDKKELSKFTKMKEGTCRAESEKWRIWSNNINHFHEITHVWVFNFLGKPNYALCEGLAVYYGDWKEKVPDKILGILRKRNFSLRELCDDSKFRELNWDYSYRQSGYLVSYLIEKFSFERFIELYKKIKWKNPINEVIKDFEEILGIKFDTLEKEFLRNLK